MVSSSEKPLLERLKERKLVQWTLGYLAGGFVVLQLMDALSEPLALGQLVQQAVVVLLCIGFIVTLVLAWYHGEQGRQRVSGPELLIIAGLLLVAGIGFRFLLSNDSTIEVAATASPEADAPVQASVAVLPFDDLSPEGDQRYFVEGLSAEIISALTKVQDLRVAARTSTFVLADQNADISTIASTLSVANVLEGSMRKAGDQIRITAQLIEAESGFPIWSETFERELTDIFQIQDEIALAVVEGMAVPLGMGSSGSLITPATEDLDAYDLYLRARTAFANRGTLEDVDGVIRLYEQATVADPDYALAHEGLAEAWAVRPNYSSQWASDLARAEEEAQIALSLDEKLPRARLVLANVHRDRWEWDEAETLYALSLSNLPNDPEAHHEYGEFLLDTGRCAEAASEHRIALDTDPLSPVFHYFLSMALLCDGQVDAAVVEGRRSQELGFPIAGGIFAFTLMEAGDVDGAVDYARATGWESYLAVAEAVRDGAPERIVPGDFVTASPLIEVWGLALVGDREAALARLGAIIGAGTPVPLRELWKPSVQQLLGEDSRYQALLEEAGITW